MPGRKTDVKDAQWIADLLRHGLLRGSFIPDRPQRELVRYRRNLVRERSRVINRIQQVLEGANIKLSSVAKDISGVSGLAMLAQLAYGDASPEEMADLTRGRLRNKRSELEQALRGLRGPHQRMMLQSQLRHLEFLAQEIGQLDQEVAQRMAPYEEAIQAADAIPGIGRRGAEDILAELGTDMDQFPSEAHLSSWAGVCPGSQESAGKRKSGKTRNGNRWLRSALVEAARSAVNKKGSYLGAQYRRLAARRGDKRAILAVAHTILVILYHMLKRGTNYQDLGSHYFDHQDTQGVLRRSVRRIEALGYKVTVEAA